MDAAATVRTYYEALRDGEPLYPFFAADTDPVKFGIGERLTGYDAVRDGLREQTRTTTDWVVESHDLRATERDRHAWFSDDVFMAWRDTEREVRHSFDTRWSGTLERRADDGDAVGDGDADDSEDEWRFVGMHVSCAVETDAEAAASDAPRETEFGVSEPTAEDET